jgi:hypothetical protein
LQVYNEGCLKARRSFIFRVVRRLRTVGWMDKPLGKYCAGTREKSESKL